MTETVIRRIWIENIKALIRQEAPVILKMIADYEAGKSLGQLKEDDELVNFLRSHGTRIEAAEKYLSENHKQTRSKPARKTKEAAKEVT